MTTTDTRDVFRTATGDLTAYAFGCGYIQTFAVDGSTGYYLTDADAVMMQQDGGVFHVHTRHDGVTYENGMPLWVDNDGGGRRRADWETFDTLREARKAFAAAKRTLRAAHDLDRRAVCAHIVTQPFQHERHRFGSIADAVAYFRRHVVASPYGAEPVPGEYPIMDLYPERDENGIACGCDSAMNFHDYPMVRYSVGPRGGIVRERV